MNESNPNKNNPKSPNYKSRQERTRPTNLPASGTRPPAPTITNSKKKTNVTNARPQSQPNPASRQVNPQATNPTQKQPVSRAARSTSVPKQAPVASSSARPTSANRPAQSSSARPSASAPVGSDTPTRQNNPRNVPARAIPSKLGPDEPTRLNQPKPTPPGKNKKPNIWLWATFGVLLILSGVGLFFYFRTSTFVNETMGAYSAPSLLSPTSLPATATPEPTATAQPVQVPAQSITATPIATVTPRPSPTATPDNSPAIVQRIKRGEKVSTLVIGYGGTGHDGAYLADTLLLITYDPAKKAVSMVNLPRDLYVLVPYGGPGVGYWGKINSSFSYIMESNNSSQLARRYRYTNDTNKIDAAANLTKDIVEEVTGIPIDYWSVFSFDGFRRLIDAIGGVDVTVDTTFDDYEYPANDNPQIDASFMHIHFDAGPAHLNGERAIQFARSRKSAEDGSDFNRSKRQMKIVQAVKEKMTKPDVLFKSLDIMDALQGKMRTSLTFDEARGLADYFRSSEGATKTNNVLFVSQILSGNFLYDTTSAAAGYILLPQAGQGNYKDIQEWLKLGLIAPELRAENRTIQIQNGTGLAKFSTSATDILRSKGFNVLQPLWANPAPITQILDYTDGKSRSTVRTLNELFPNAYVKTAVRPYQDSPDVVVVLGKDYAAPATNSNSSTSSEVADNLSGGNIKSRESNSISANRP